MQQHTSAVEEIANSVTHGLGLILAIIATAYLILAKNLEFWGMLGLYIFSLSVILTYTFSTLYHSLYFTQAKTTFKRLDHASIYLLIAGTYTPFILIYLKSQIGFIILTIVWVLSLLGIGYKVLYIFRKKITAERGKLQIIVYLILGWLSVVLVVPMINNMPILVISLLVSGGLFYTLGTIFIVWKTLKFNHSIWHLFVLFGTISHFLALLYL